MNLRRALAVLCVVGVAACSAAPAGSVQPQSRGPLRSVRDDLGSAVEVRPAPLRIVSLTPGATEMLFAAGGGGQLIATVQYSSEPAAARAVPRIGDVATIDMERLVALRPEVVIAWPAGGNPAQRAKIAALGNPLYQQQVARLADLPASLRRLGTLAGTEAVAEQSAAALEARLSALERTYSAATPLRQRPTVLLQVWNRPIYTVGGRHLMSDALELCGSIYHSTRQNSHSAIGWRCSDAPIRCSNAPRRWRASRPPLATRPAAGGEPAAFRPPRSPHFEGRPLGHCPREISPKSCGAVSFTSRLRRTRC